MLVVNDRYSELASHKVCVSADSIAATYLYEHNVGFSVVESAGTVAMFASFWNEECDAILYDAPLLEYNLWERTVECAASSNAPAETCKANGLLVGQRRTHDPYGIVLPEGHPAHEALSIASISRITASGFTEDLTERWFPGEDTVEDGEAAADDTAEVQVEWRFVAACAIGISGLLLKMFTPPFGRLVAEEAKLYGELRAVHARVITHSEEIAFYGGHEVSLCTTNLAKCLLRSGRFLKYGLCQSFQVEHGVLWKTYSSLVKHMNKIYRVRIGYTMLEQFLMKYNKNPVAHNFDIRNVCFQGTCGVLLVSS